MWVHPPFFSILALQFEHFLVQSIVRHQVRSRELMPSRRWFPPGRRHLHHPVFFRCCFVGCKTASAC
jgi:hypothetical protein